MNTDKRTALIAGILEGLNSGEKKSIHDIASKIENFNFRELGSPALLELKQGLPIKEQVMSIILTALSDTALLILDEEKPSSFRSELEKLINKHSLENGSNTPDFILAEYLHSCLSAFNKATNRRDDFYADEKPDTTATPPETTASAEPAAAVDPKTTNVRQCVECGKSLDGFHKKAKFCSNSCYKKNWNAKKKASQQPAQQQTNPDQPKE